VLSAVITDNLQNYYSISKIWDFLCIVIIVFDELLHVDYYKNIFIQNHYFILLIIICHIYDYEILFDDFLIILLITIWRLYCWSYYWLFYYLPVPFITVLKVVQNGKWTIWFLDLRTSSISYMSKKFTEH